jgi:hypothetical protein
MTTEDWLLRALREVEDAVEFAQSELAAAKEVLATTRADRADGVPLVKLAADLAQRGGATRRSVAAAILEYERAVASLRAQVVRVLIDEEGITLAALARQMNVSRQAVTRIYRASDGA